MAKVTRSGSRAAKQLAHTSTESIIARSEVTASYADASKRGQITMIQGPHALKLQIMHKEFGTYDLLIESGTNHGQGIIDWRELPLAHRSIVTDEPEFRVEKLVEMLKEYKKNIGEIFATLLPNMEKLAQEDAETSVDQTAGR